MHKAHSTTKPVVHTVTRTFDETSGLRVSIPAQNVPYWPWRREGIRGDVDGYPKDMSHVVCNKVHWSVEGLLWLIVSSGLFHHNDSIQVVHSPFSWRRNKIKTKFRSLGLVHVKNVPLIFDSRMNRFIHTKRWAWLTLSPSRGRFTLLPFLFVRIFV